MLPNSVGYIKNKSQSLSISFKKNVLGDVFMVEYVKGKIVQGEMRDNWVHLTISEHSGIFQSEGIMRLVLNERAARDFTKHFPRDVIGRELRGKGGQPLPETVIKYFVGRRITMVIE